MDYRLYKNANILSVINTHQYMQAPTNNDHFGPSKKTTDGANQFDAANTQYRMLRLQCTKFVQITLHFKKNNRMQQSTKNGK